MDPVSILRRTIRCDEALKQETLAVILAEYGHSVNAPYNPRGTISPRTLAIRRPSAGGMYTQLCVKQISVAEMCVKRICMLTLENMLRVLDKVESRLR